MTRQLLLPILTLALVLTATLPVWADSDGKPNVPLGLSVGPLTQPVVSHRPPPRPTPPPVEGPRELRVGDLDRLHFPHSSLFVRLTGWAEPSGGSLVVGDRVVLGIGAATRLEPPLATSRWSRYRGQLTAEGWLFPPGRHGQWRLKARIVEFHNAVAPEPDPDPVYYPVSTAELIRDPLAWDGRRVRVVGTWRSGFEVSTLDDRIWLNGSSYEGFPPDWFGGCKRHEVPHDHEHLVEQKRAPCRCMPVMHYRSVRVEVTGTIHSSQRAYGHMGLCVAELDADRIVYLGSVAEPIY